jgi:phage-related protein (TIGR01555 family)
MSILDFFRGEKPEQVSALTHDDVIASIGKKNIEPYREPTRESAINSALSAMAWAVDNDSNMPVNTADDASSTMGISTALSLEVVNWYARQTFIGWQACSIMSTHWLIGRACSMPIDDAIKNGWEITSRKKDTSIDDSIATILSEAEEHFDVRKKLHNFGVFGRVFGVRVAIFRIDGYTADEYAKPLNFDDVSSERKYKGFSLVDPQYCTPVITNSSDPIADNFMKVTFWQVGGIRYHHSFCVEYIHTPVSQTMKAVYMNAGGISLVQEMYEKVYLAEQAALESNRLLFSKRVWVRSGDVESALLDQDAFEQKMGFFARAINNFGTLLLGENETLNKHETSLQEVTSVIGQKFEHVCAVSGVPSNRLMMTQLTGFASSGEAEEKIYYDLVRRLQCNNLLPVLEMHTRLTLLSNDLPDDDFVVTFKPAGGMTANEIADINLKKSQTDTALAGIQAISPEAIAEKWAKDPHGGYAGIDLADYAAQEQDDFSEGMADFGGDNELTESGKKLLSE